MTTAGRTILGEPHHEPAKVETASEIRVPRLPSLEEIKDLKTTLMSISPQKLGIGALALMLLAVIWFVMSLPGESLADRTALTAQKFAEDDLAYLKQIASVETVDDVVRWFDVVHPKLVKAREQWKTKSTNVRVTVIDENLKQRVGEAQAFVYPKAGPAHEATIKSAAETTPTRIEPVDLKMHWLLDKRGRWRLNGRMTLQAAGSTNIETVLQ